MILFLLLYHSLILQHIHHIPTADISPAQIVSQADGEKHKRRKEKRRYHRGILEKLLCRETGGMEGKYRDGHIDDQAEDEGIQAQYQGCLLYTSDAADEL